MPFEFWIIWFSIVFSIIYPVVVSRSMGGTARRRIDKLYAQAAVAHNRLLQLEAQLSVLRAQFEVSRTHVPATTAAPQSASVPVPDGDLKPAQRAAPQAAPQVAPQAPPQAPPAQPVDAPALSSEYYASDKDLETQTADEPATTRDNAERQDLQPPPQFDAATRAEAPAWLINAKNWLFTGNVVAKAGLVILFIGVSFLLKYVASRVVVPIELRLCGIVVTDLALLTWGWRMRAVRRDLSLPIQGAALAILMLVTFAAFRLYSVIPGGVAFALLFVLTATTCVLAALQDAIWLAVFGIIGGFAAPVLTSTGSGNYIALFSYYALLNAGILALALRRVWRTLNLLGFAFTFSIGTAWGMRAYSPADFWPVEAFLILFLLYYVAIAVAYAVRQETASESLYVDATLVFGTPLLAFGLQAGMLKNNAFGLAASALTMALLYAALAMLLWRRRAQRIELLTDAFLSLAVVFGTVTLPLALDGRWTAAAWALEGAAMVWIGLRQGQTKTWAFGLLVQAGAWLSFARALPDFRDGRAHDAQLWLGLLMLGAAAYSMAVNFRARRDDPGRALFSPLADGLLAIAAFCLLASAWVEICLRTSDTAQANLLVISALLAAAALAVIGRRRDWAIAGHYALILQLLGGIALLASFRAWDWPGASANLFDKPLLGAALIAGSALLSSWNFSRHQAKPGALAATLLTVAACWYYGPVLHTLSGWIAMRYALAGGPDFSGAQGAAYEMAVAASAVGAVTAARRLGWPALRWLGLPCWGGLALATLAFLYRLNIDERLPTPEQWLGFAALWLGGEFLLTRWRHQPWPLGSVALRLLHTIRSGGPWLMVWPTGAILIADWLAVRAEQRPMLSADGLSVSGSWANFLPAWAMMAAIAWLIQRAQRDQWPTTPISTWYRRVLIPAATAWVLLLVLCWNLAQNGAMAPLPYVPLLNPLDLSTGFALLLGVACARLLRVALAPFGPDSARFFTQLPLIGALLVFGWFNLMLLRSAAHYLGIAYQLDALVDNLFIEAMLSLVWSVTALLLMRYAARTHQRRYWVLGACLLGVVAAKLFLVDLTGVGSVARIVSFVGVGFLMVLIGYLAPFPAQEVPLPAPQPEHA